MSQRENYTGVDPRYRLGCMRNGKDVVELAKKELLSPYPSTSLSLWNRFTEVTGGLRAREFSILCGATGTGKTTFLANISMQLLLQKEKHFVASVETGDTDFVKRVISSLMEEDLNTGESVSEEKIKEFESRFSNYFDGSHLMLSIFNNRIKLSQLISDLEIAHARYGCKVALLDNLNFFMEMTAEKNQVVEMDRTIHELIMFCKRIDMHLIMVMHPKKTENGRVESEFDIKGSSTAVQEAHNVFLFNRPKAEDWLLYPPSRFRELKIVKLRRRGKYVGSRLMFENHNSYYAEGALL